MTVNEAGTVTSEEMLAKLRTALEEAFERGSSFHLHPEEVELVLRALKDQELAETDWKIIEAVQDAVGDKLKLRGELAKEAHELAGRGATRYYAVAQELDRVAGNIMELESYLAKGGR